MPSRIRRLCEYASKINDFQLDIGINDITGSPLLWPWVPYLSVGTPFDPSGCQPDLVKINHMPFCPWRVTNQD